MSEKEIIVYIEGYEKIKVKGCKHKQLGRVIEGSKDTINMYLRMTLDKWEDIILTGKRNAVWDVRDGKAKGEILKEFNMAKNKAFKEWYAELRLNRWKVEWVEDGRQKYQAADHFFLGEG